MEKITSFTIDHNKLVPGIYVSRKDNAGDTVVTTFDIRITNPNEEPVMNTAEIHTIEHLGATFLRNHDDYKQNVLYFGPMGCRTGFYLLLTGDHSSREILPLIKEMFTFIAGYTGDIPGASARDCGNYLDMNLPMANYIAKKFIKKCSPTHRTISSIIRTKQQTKQQPESLFSDLRQYFGILTAVYFSFKTYARI